MRVLAELQRGPLTRGDIGRCSGLRGRQVDAVISDIREAAPTFGSQLVVTRSKTGKGRPATYQLVSIPVDAENARE
jgi:chromosome segregation and condensation protein ScpB